MRASILIPIVAALLLTLIATHVETTSAQENDDAFVAMTIDIMHGDFSENFVPFRNLYGELRAFADNVECTYTPLSDDPALNQPGGVIGTLVIGTADQPAACRREGAEITMFDGRGIKRFITFTLHSGAAEELRNLSPVPADSEEPIPPRTLPAAGSGGLADQSQPAPWLPVLAGISAAAAVVGSGLAIRRRSPHGDAGSADDW